MLSFNSFVTITIYCTKGAKTAKEGDYKIFNFFIFHPIFTCFFWLPNDHLYGLLMGHWHCFCYLIVKRGQRWCIFVRYIEFKKQTHLNLMFFFPLNQLYWELSVVCWQISSLKVSEKNLTERDQRMQISKVYMFLLFIQF